MKPDPKSKAKNVIEDDYEDDLDWNDDGWGDADFGEVDNKKAASKDAPKADTKPKNEKNRAGYYGQDLQDDFDKPEDKFNKVLSTSKENGGLLASIGLKNKDIANEDGSLDGDSEEAPHNKSDLFDTSKDRIAKKAGAKAKGKESDEDFDLGFSSIKKQADKEPAQETKKAKDDDEPSAEEQRREIEDQFKSLYDNDPELRKALERSDVANFTVEEKYQIIEAYMQSGFNAAELQIELEDDDEKALAEMSEEDIELLNANFAQIYARDPELKAMLPEDISQLTLLQKYQILVHY